MYGYSVFNDDTGEIVFSGLTSSYDQIQLQANGNGLIVFGEQLDRDLWFFDGGEPRLRPKVFDKLEHRIRANGEDRVYVPYVPVGTVFTDQRGAFVGQTVEGEEIFDFTATKPGVIILHVAPPFPWRPQQISISVDPIEGGSNEISA